MPGDNDASRLGLHLKNLEDIFDHWWIFWQVNVEYKGSAVDTFAWRFIGRHFGVVKGSMRGSFLSQHFVYR